MKSPLTAGVIALVTVFLAIALGLAAANLTRRPAPTPRRVVVTSTPAPATRSPAPTTDPNVFKQRLSSGCATAQAVWVVANGGGLLRFDGKDWSQIDGTLRSLVSASCDDAILYAVGGVGAVLQVDDRSKQIRAIDVITDDLFGIAPLPDGAIAVGSRGNVTRLIGGFWQPYARGIDEDLYAIVAFSGESAWAVGSGGVSYRLEPAGWRPVKTGTEVALRAVTGPAVQLVFAVGDAGTILGFSASGWTKIESGVDANLRAVTLASGVVWIVGDGGVVLVLPAQGGAVKRVDIGATCNLTSVFPRGEDVWIVGSNGATGGVWRLRGGAVAERWGAC